MGEKMMQIEIQINGKKIRSDIEADTLLIDFLRKQGCYSVKRGCETANCGACTVLMDDKPVLSCGVLAARAAGHRIVTLEGMQEETADLVDFLAAQGADQCGFCNPGYVMNTMALLMENPQPTEQEIREYLAGNLCRCSGYESQIRGIQAYLAYRQGKDEGQQ
jgi:carbon-monoxide dehydrogenase small subunit